MKQESPGFSRGECQYSDVALTLRKENAVEHECDDYSLKRIGEEYSDIDEEMGGEDYDMADCCMIVRDFEIGSSKGELTIDKLAQEEH